MPSATKKIIIAVLLLAVAVSAVPLPTRAQFDESGMASRESTTNAQVINTSNTINSEAQRNINSGATQAQAVAAGTATNTADPGCNLSSNGLGMCISYVVYIFAIGIPSQLAYVGAYFFDLTVQLSLNSAAYSLAFLTTGWGTVRDLANMFFIFILIYTAFEIMFQAESAGTMRRIALIIIMALLINFSFFITRVVIDTGNILGLQFYNAIQVTGENGQPAYIGNGTKDLSFAVMNAVNVQKLYSTQEFKTWNDNNKGGFLTTVITLSFIYITLGIMYGLLFVVFLTAGVKFMMRVVGLWFVIISAPLAFVARTLTKTEPYYKQWQEYLVKFSLYPAVFLFMYYILVSFMNQLGNSQTGGLVNGIFRQLSTTGTQGTNTGTLNALGTIAIEMGFVIAMMYVALKASDWVVKEGSGMAHAAVSWMGNAAAGTAGFGLRRTAGWGMQRLSESNRLRNLAADNVVARTLWRGTSRLGKSTWDARNTKVAQRAGTLAGLSLAKGSGDTFADIDKARAARKTAEGEALKPSKANIEKARESVIFGQTKEVQEEIAKAAKAYDIAKKQADETGSEEDKKALREAKKEFDTLMKPINDAVEEKTGAGNADKYAQTMTTPRLTNLFIPAKSNYEALSKLRDSKNKAGQILGVLKKKGVIPGTPTPVAVPAAPAGATTGAQGTPPGGVGPNRGVASQRMGGNTNRQANAPGTTGAASGGGGSAFNQMAGTADTIKKYVEATTKEQKTKDAIFSGIPSSADKDNVVARAVEKVGEKLDKNFEKQNIQFNKNISSLKNVIAPKHGAPGVVGPGGGIAPQRVEVTANRPVNAPGTTPRAQAPVPPHPPQAPRPIAPPTPPAPPPPPPPPENK